MKEKKEDNFNDLDSFNGRHAFISESFILIAANQIEESSKEKNLPPTAFIRHQPTILGTQPSRTIEEDD